MVSKDQVKSFITLVLVLLFANNCFCGTRNFKKRPPKPNPKKQTIRSIESAHSYFKAGKIVSITGETISVGGLLVAIWGVQSKNPITLIVGNIIYNVGLPVNGIGTSIMKRQISRISTNPTIIEYSSGWPYYAAGWVFSTFSILFTDSENINDGETTILLVGSALSGLVAWYKFSTNRRKMIENKINFPRFTPAISLNERNQIQYSLNTSYNF